MNKEITFKGQKIEMESWAHQLISGDSTQTINNYNDWMNLQNEIYDTKKNNLSQLLYSFSRAFKHPLSQEEIENISFNAEPYSAIPILEEVKNYHSQNHLIKPTLMYLGAGNDFEHSSLFFPETSIFVDRGDYYKDAANTFAPYFKKMGYKTNTETTQNVSSLALEENGFKKDFIFIQEDMKNKEAIEKILQDKGITSLDFLIQKKASGIPECGLNYSDMLHKGGLFLYSDVNVYKNIPGMNQLWHGELYSFRLQDGGDIESYPAKLFRKE